MNTTAGVYLALGSAPSVVALIAAHSLWAALALMLVGLAAVLAREIRLGLRERRDDDTARYIFDRCEGLGGRIRALRTRP